MSERRFNDLAARTWVLLLVSLAALWFSLADVRSVRALEKRLAELERRNGIEDVSTEASK